MGDQFRAQRYHIYHRDRTKGDSLLTFLQVQDTGRYYCWMYLREETDGYCLNWQAVGNWPSVQNNLCMFYFLIWVRPSIAWVTIWRWRLFWGLYYDFGIGSLDLVRSFFHMFKKIVKVCELQVTGKILNLDVLKHHPSGPAFFISLCICIANCGFLSVYSFPLFNTYPRLTSKIL